MGKGGQTSAPAPDDQPLALQITVLSDGKGADEVGVAYGFPVSLEQAKRDISALANACGSPAGDLKTATRAGIVTVEAKMKGLTNWRVGTINLDALNRTFRRVSFFRVLCLFRGAFPARGTTEWRRPPLRIRAQVADLPGEKPGTVAQRIVDYQIWVDQSRGIPERLPSVARGSTPGTNKSIIGAGVAATVGAALFVALAVGIGVYFRMARRRRGS
jgi:hypothetical protein